LRVLQVSVTYLVESAYYDVAYNDFPGKTIHSNVYGWFYISCAVILVVYNDIGYNDNPDITMLFLNENGFLCLPITNN